MKVVILAGGYGTRISEESHLRPKPMIEIGGKPILWHIMKSYSYHGFNEFVICAGYKQHLIKEWFADYFLHNSDITFDFTEGSDNMIVHNGHVEPWKVTIVDTGLKTQTGGRIKRIQKFIGNNTFMLTYGDGVCDVDINDIYNYHMKMGRYATVTSVTIGQNKGVLDISNDGYIEAFREKSRADGLRINGGFMVLEPQVFNYIDGDSVIFERGPMERLAHERQLVSYRYDGFWQCMDTKREMEKLEELIGSGRAPWMKWETS